MTPTINVLLSSFPGLNLPTTLCIPVTFDCTVSDLTNIISSRLPFNLNNRLILTTNSNVALLYSSTESLRSLLSKPENAYPSTNLLPLRLTVPLCGGKGGFGSQLRAAGGRMSSRKKRAQGENNGSSRNLDGRRLRTVTEAKALAEYLAVRPEMEKKEKEERRRRWEQVVEQAERREEEVRSGKAGANKGRSDGKWIEAKEEQETKMREAILAAMKRSEREDIGSSEESVEGSASDSENEAVDSVGSNSKVTTPSVGSEGHKCKSRKIFGWDEEDQDMSDSEDDKGDGDAMIKQ